MRDSGFNPRKKKEGASMETNDKFDSYGSGYGYGYGYGSGSGYGDGDGYGSGSGDGYGSGDGDGKSGALRTHLEDNNLFTSVFLAQQRPLTALLRRAKRKLAVEHRATKI